MFRKSLFVILIISMIIVAGSVSPVTAEDVVTVEKEVVTGSRIYTDLAEVPAATYVLDRETIEKSGASGLSELLSQIPGISTRSRAGNTQGEFVEMRGLTTEMLILVDGIPYYRTSHVAGAAAVDLRSLPIENIDRIEVVKGAGSSVYGSMAAAGVINIVTGRSDQTQASVIAEGGSNEWKRGSFQASIAGDMINGRVWYSHKEEGESPLLSYSGAVGEFENRNLDYNNDSGGFSLNSGPWEMSAAWGSYSSEWTYGNDPEEQKNDFSRYILKYQEGNNLFLLYLDDQEQDVFQYGSWTNVDDQAWGAEYSRNTFWKEALISWGIAYRNEEMTYDLAAWFINYDRSRRNYAPFLEVSVPVGDMVMDVGIRYENWDQNDAEDYEELIPHISFSYQTTAGSLWYLSAGRFFAMPSLYELSYFDNWIATEPNLSLQPEEGWSYEMGCKGRNEKGSWNVGIFYLEMDNRIDILPDYSQYVNLAEFRSWGIESLRSWRISPPWEFALGITWMEAEERETSESSWIKGGTPEWDINAALAYNKGPFSGKLQLNYLGDREDEREGIGSLSQEDVVTMDVLMQWKTDAGTLILSGYNILDEEYYLQDYTSWGTTTRYYGQEARYYVTWKCKF